jgi:hypothetical protein
MKASELFYVFTLIVLAIFFTEQCGGAVDVPPLEQADAAPDASAVVAESCYAPADPFRAYACDAPGVSCACPDCYVADAGVGTCTP